MFVSWQKLKVPATARFQFQRRSESVWNMKCTYFKQILVRSLLDLASRLHSETSLLRVSSKGDTQSLEEGRKTAWHLRLPIMRA